MMATLAGSTASRGPAMTETHERLAQEYYPSMSGKTDRPSKGVGEETPEPTKDVGGGQGGVQLYQEEELLKEELREKRDR